MNDAERLARATLDALNERDLERIRDLVTDDFVDHGSPVKMPPGPDGYIAILTFVTEVLQIRYEIEDVVASGDMVAVRAVAHGINAVAPQGIEPTMRPYAMKAAHFFKARGDRLCQHWGIRDELDVLFQVGALTPPAVPLGSLAR
jgi:predicted ester cyclase